MARDNPQDLPGSAAQKANRDARLAGPETDNLTKG